MTTEWPTISFRDVGSIERRVRERNEKRELILGAAMKLFLEESFEKTTMRRIADAIEYTPGALYGYFKDKDEILFEIHERGFEELIARKEEAMAGLTDPAARLAAMGRAYIRFALDNPRQYELMFMAKSTSKKIIEDAEWKSGLCSHEMLRTEVKALLEQRGSTVDPDIAAFSCWSLVHGIVSLVIADRCIFIPPEHIPAVVEGAYAHFLAMMNGPTATAST